MHMHERGYTPFLDLCKNWREDERHDHCGRDEDNDPAKHCVSDGQPEIRAGEQVEDDVSERLRVDVLMLLAKQELSKA